MKQENPIKLKKYLFLISVAFFVVIFSHLLWNYVYENSEIKPKKGGSISEGLIGKFPTLNPLRELSGNNEYVLRYLYRSLLSYDINQEKIVGDIASCDISSLVNIDCVINDDAFWSNGEKISSDDIVSTYNLIKETNSNPEIASSLKDVEIEANGDRIVFKNTVKDTNFLNIFFQPIISQKTIDSLSKQNIEGSFSSEGGIYSGDYIVEGVKTDDNLGVASLILMRNEEYSDANISKIIFYVFPDENSFKVNKSAINVFNDEFNTIGDSIPRFESNRYNLYQFLSVFINSQKIEHKNLRTIILNEINRDHLIKHLGEVNYRAIYNPFFTDTKTKTTPANNNLEEVLASLGYKKKARLIEEYQQGGSSDSETSGESGETTEAEVELQAAPEKLDRSAGLARYQKDSAIISSPSYVDIYNFITKDDFKLVGKVKDGVDAVYINDYKLQGFSAGDSEFYYRVKEDEGFNNITEGENTYKIYFEINGNKELQEEIHFLYYKNSDTLKTEQEKFIASLYDTEEAELQAEYEKQVAAKTEEENTDTQADLETQEEPNKVDKQLQALENLDDKLYYSSDLEPYTLDLVYLNTRKDFDDTAQFIRETLKEIGITVNLQDLPRQEFSKALIEKKYDMILGGIDSGYFSLNLFPYFHSSQAESGFNYGAFKRLSLDTIIEESKENIYNEEKTKELEKKILDIFTEEQVFKTLYSPKMNLLVDKNINLATEINTLPKSSLRNEIIQESYIKEEKVFSLEGKNISGFIAYIFKKLYE